MPHFIAHLPPQEPFSLPDAFQAIHLLRFQTVNRDRSLTLHDMHEHYGLDDKGATDIQTAAEAFRSIPPVLPPPAREDRDRSLKKEIDELESQLDQIASERQRLVEKGKVQLAKLSAELSSDSLDKHRQREQSLRHELDLLDAMTADLRRRMAECRDGIGAKPLLGVDEFLDKLLVCLMIQRNAVLEGSPGLAKTSIIKTLADMLGLDYSRIQFTPDLTAADIAGRFEEEKGTDGKTRTQWRPGPVFTNLLLCDELNRAPAQIQNALIELAEERQVTVTGGGGASRLLRPLTPVNEARLIVEHTGYFGEEPAHSPNDPRVQSFITLSTMNTLDSEGTYSIGDAVNDRFALKLRLDYPGHDQMSQLGDHAFEAEAAAPARKAGAPTRESPQTAAQNQKKPLMAKQLHKVNQQESTEELASRTTSKVRIPVRKAIRAEKASSVVIDNRIVPVDELEDIANDDLETSISANIRARFSPHVPLPYSPLPDPPRATFHEQGQDLGKALELGHRDRGRVDDENKTPYYRSQREEQEHVRTLYFLLRLRKMMLGPDMLQAWNSAGNTELRERLTLLVDFTHLRPYDWADRPGGATLPPSAKDRELKALLEHWRENPGNYPKHAGYAELVQSLLEEEAYPLVVRGSSPRGLISLVRAVHAAALLRRGQARPDWSDVAWIARDCLRHRLQLGEDATGQQADPDNVIKALTACLA